MSKNIIFLIIAIAIIAGGWFYFRGKNELVASLSIPEPASGSVPAPTAPSPAAQSNTIRYTNSGYEPNELRVKADETVTFVNESSDAVWTASNPHPTHTNLPEFDEKQQSAPGTEYSFTFTEKGTWRYHNHINPGHTGTIIIE